MWSRFLESNIAVDRRKERTLNTSNSSSGADEVGDDLKCLSDLIQIKNLDDELPPVEVVPKAPNVQDSFESKRKAKTSPSAAGRYLQSMDFASQPSLVLAQSITSEEREANLRKENLILKRHLLVVTAEAEATQKVVDILVDQGDQLRLERESMHIVSRSTMNATSEIVDDYRRASITLASQGVAWKAIVAASSALASRAEENERKAQTEIKAEMLSAAAAKKAMRLEKEIVAKALARESEKVSSALTSAKKAKAEAANVASELTDAIDGKEKVEEQCHLLENEVASLVERLREAERFAEDASNRMLQAQVKLEMSSGECFGADRSPDVTSSSSGSQTRNWKNRSVMLSELINTKEGHLQNDFGAVLVNDEEAAFATRSFSQRSDCAFSAVEKFDDDGIEPGSELKDCSAVDVAGRYQGENAMEFRADSSLSQNVVVEGYDMAGDGDGKNVEGYYNESDGYHRDKYLSRKSSQRSTFEEEEVMQMWVSPNHATAEETFKDDDGCTT